MQYRTFGRLDWKPSALGFGAMRLPTIGGDHRQIDEEQATSMLHMAINSGVNYVDTAWPYHGEQSEPFIGRCLRGGHRGRVRLATKLPSWLVEKQADFDRFLDRQLERLQTDHVDFYLLHGLNRLEWPKLRDLGILSAAERAIADGRIGYLGFSFHDDLALFKEIVDAYDWTLCQIMYNYMDVAFQAGREGLQHAAEKGLAVVVMEPLRGGSLTRPAPKAVAALWQEARQERSQADWALQWVWNHAEVSIALSGMTDVRQVEENLASADRSRVGGLSAQELELIDRVREAYRELSPVPCTGCRYCMPCPQGLNIPWLLSLYNDMTMYDSAIEARRSYMFTRPEGKADRCVACQRCERSCPQQIPITKWLRIAHAALDRPSPTQETRTE